jgi:hypothetical protein
LIDFDPDQLPEAVQDSVSEDTQDNEKILLFGNAGGLSLLLALMSTVGGLVVDGITGSIWHV